MFYHYYDHYNCVIIYITISLSYSPFYLFFLCAYSTPFLNKTSYPFLPRMLKTSTFAVENRPAATNLHHSLAP